jgi:WD40 repeat protein
VPGGVSSLSFDPSSQRIVVGSSDGGVRIYDASTGTELVALNGQLGQVNSARFSPDGGRVVTTGPDGTRVWSADSGLPLSSYSRASVYGTATPSGGIVISYRASQPAELHDCEICSLDPDELLDLAEQRITREPTDAEIKQYGL